MAGIGVSGRELFTLPPFCSAINLSGPIAAGPERRKKEKDRGIKDLNHLPHLSSFVFFFLAARKDLTVYPFPPFRRKRRKKGRGDG